MLSPLFQPLDQDQQIGNDCRLLLQCFRITLKDASSISIDPIGLSSLHKFYFFSNLYIPRWLWKKFIFVVFSKWKMDLQTKKLKVNISHTSWQSALTGPYHDSLRKYNNISISIFHAMQTYFSSARGFRIMYISIVEPDI